MSSAQTPGLPESRLYTFIDEDRELALYFLEGQRLIRELALVHPIQRGGFAYFRDVTLSIQPLIALLKHGEQLGFYVDSSEPSFLLKIEAGHNGAMRCMLLPEDFAEFPEAMRGLVRLQKLFPNNRPPYESILEIDGQPLAEIVNRVLRDSYQVNSTLMLSQVSDQSVLLHQLPPLPGKDDYDYSPEALEAWRARIRHSIDEIFSRALLHPAEVEAAFGEAGFRLLVSRPVRFVCSCSRERVLQNLRPVWLREGESLFDPGQEQLEVRCEYCKSRYGISRDDLDRAANPLN